MAQTCLLGCLINRKYKVVGRRFTQVFKLFIWVGIPYVEAGLTVNQVAQPQLVRLQHGPPYENESKQRPRRVLGFLDKEN